MCESGETPQNCPLDCGSAGPVCGNNVCESGETAQSCPLDCMTTSNCAHSPCSTGVALNANCSLCVSDVCFIDSYCCTVDWDASCVSWAVLLSCTC
jgi:hypothetical protein